MSDEPKSAVDRAIKPAVSVTAIVAVWAILWPFLARAGSPTIVDVGQWLSGVAQPIALFWFVMAFFLQHQELSLQRKELAETRAEIRRQADSSSANAVALQRSIFLQLRPQFFELMDRTTYAIRAILEPYPNAFATEYDDRLESMSALIAGALHNRADPRYPIEALVEHFVSPAGKARAAQYVSTMNELLTLAIDCDEGRIGAFSDLVRATSYFGWYKVLLRLYPELETHEAALGTRPTDHHMRLWEDRDFALLIGGNG